MQLTPSKPSDRLLQIRRRANFGRAIRPAEGGPAHATAPAPAQAGAKPAVAVRVPEGDGVEGSRRRNRRVAVSDEVGIRRIGSFNFHAKMHDVSVGGCRVELIESYEVGDHVVARLPKLEPLGARVCWAKGTTAGIEFLNGMHPAVFDSLLMRLAAPASSPAEA